VRLALPVLAAALLLAACSTTQKTAKGVGDAVTQPLNDLNLVHAEIPPVLVAAAKGPYVEPPDSSCPALTAEVVELDAALGADLDTPSTAVNPSLIERGAGLAADMTIGQVRGIANAIVPYRGWVRKLSGAERYSKDVQAAIAAGVIRRAYLKGLGRAGYCSFTPESRVTQR
jgi:hypothetical protein